MGPLSGPRGLTTSPISFFSDVHSSTVSSNTMFMNWSNPRSTPVTCRPRPNPHAPPTPNGQPTWGTPSSCGPGTQGRITKHPYQRRGIQGLRVWEGGPRPAPRGPGSVKGSSGQEIRDSRRAPTLRFPFNLKASFLSRYFLRSGPPVLDMLARESAVLETGEGANEGRWLGCPERAAKHFSCLGPSKARGLLLYRTAMGTPDPW